MIRGHAEVHVSLTRVICDIRCRRGVVRCMFMGGTATQIDDYCLPLHARRSPVVSVHCPCLSSDCRFKEAVCHFLSKERTYRQGLQIQEERTVVSAECGHEKEEAYQDRPVQFHGDGRQ